MNTITRALLALAAGLALASPAALAAPRVVGGPSPTPSTSSKPSAVKKAVDDAAKRNDDKSGIAGIGKGDTEFGLSLMYDNYEDEDRNQLTLTASVGQFISDRAEITIQPTILWSDSPGTSTYGLLPFFGFKYLFRGATLKNPVVPYVGAGIGINLLNSDSDLGGSTFIWGIDLAPMAGVKAFVTERASIEYQLRLNVGIVEACGDVDCVDGNSTGFNNLLLFNIYY